MKAYSVVFWSQTLAIVPANWINYEDMSFRWPKTKNPLAHVLKAPTPSDDYLTIQYERLVGSFGSYDEARNFEVEAQDISTSNEDALTSLREEKINKSVARTVCKPLRYCSTPENEQGKAKSIESKRPRIESSSEEEKIDSEFNLPAVPTGYKDTSEFVEAGNSSAELDIRKYFAKNTLLTSPQKNIPNDLSIYLSEDEGKNVVKEHIFEKVLAELENLKKTVSAIYLMMIEKGETYDNIQNYTLSLPVVSQNQLTAFELKLKDARSAAQYKHMIQRIGGKTAEKHIRNALGYTHSNDMAYRASWTGAKQTIMIKDMRFIKIIKDCIQECVDRLYRRYRGSCHQDMVSACWR